MYISNFFRGLPVNCRNRDGPLREDILEAIHKRLFYMTEKFSRVLFFRFDLRIPQEFFPLPPDNEKLSAFLNSFTTYLNRSRIEYQYVWVREQHSSQHPHYHLIFFLNGNLTVSPHNHLKRAEKLWTNLFNNPDVTENRGLLHRCNRRADGGTQSNHILISRNSDRFYDDVERCFRWASYLAKMNTKGSAPRNVREWDASLIRKRPNANS